MREPIIFRPCWVPLILGSCPKFLDNDVSGAHRAGGHQDPGPERSCSKDLQRADARLAPSVKSRPEPYIHVETSVFQGDDIGIIWDPR